MKLKNKITHYDYDKYFTIPEFNKLTVENFAARFFLNKMLPQINQNIY